MQINNQVQLITYPDSLGADLPALERLLQQYFQDVFPGGIHILPPFPSSADRGFAPTDYFQIDPRFGSWEDLRRLGERFPVLLDLMVNHLSRQSAYFKDFARRGRRSPHAGLFLTLDKIWPGADPPAEEVEEIFLRRPAPPFVEIPIAETGEVERVWATFGTAGWSEQIDLDVNSAATRALFADILAHFSRHGVKFVRLDAVAYVTKKPGTNCFFVEPEIYEFLKWMEETAQGLGIGLLPEVHAQPELQVKLARRGYRVYNFILPLLVLHTFTNRSSAALQQHLHACPQMQFTNLDTHDGIPVWPDLAGALDLDSAQVVVQKCLERGANLSRIFSPRHQPRPDFDAHQINITYYDALGRDDQAYIAARAIQLFSPGVPQIYYVGLLAGENDLLAVERTGERRAINRHNFTEAEVERALEKPVIRRLLELIRFRNRHPAFNGDFRVIDSPEHLLRLAWKEGDAYCELQVDLERQSALIQHRTVDGKLIEYRP